MQYSHHAMTSIYNQYNILRRYFKCVYMLSFQNPGCIFLLEQVWAAISHISSAREPHTVSSYHHGQGGSKFYRTCKDQLSSFLLQDSSSSCSSLYLPLHCHHNAHQHMLLDTFFPQILGLEVLSSQRSSKHINICFIHSVSTEMPDITFQ